MFNAPSWPPFLVPCALVLCHLPSLGFSSVDHSHQWSIFFLSFLLSFLSHSLDLERRLFAFVVPCCLVLILHCSLLGVYLEGIDSGLIVSSFHSTESGKADKRTIPSSTSLLQTPYLGISFSRCLSESPAFYLDIRPPDRQLRWHQGKYFLLSHFTFSLQGFHPEPRLACVHTERT